MKSLSDKLEKLQSTYSKMKKLQNQTSRGTRDDGAKFIWYDQIDEIFNLTAKAVGVPGGMDQGVPIPGTWTSNAPINVNHEDDRDAELRKVGNRMFYMKEVGTQKGIFLKTLSNHLFNSFDGRYTLANTLVIDDSPIKHMLNLSENIFLLPTWSYGGDGAVTNSVLMEELLSYLLNLHRSQEGLAE